MWVSVDWMGVKLMNAEYKRPVKRSTLNWPGDIENEWGWIREKTYDKWVSQKEGQNQEFDKLLKTYVMFKEQKVMKKNSICGYFITFPFCSLHNIAY